MALVKSDLLFRKQVNEVNLILSVRDKKGHFVNGLGAGDFSIFDNDLRQTQITFFQNQTDLPLDVAVVLDASSSVGARFEAEQHAITQFLHQTIRHEDSAVLIAFNQAIRVIAPINYNWRDLSRRLKKVKPDGETAIYDAVATAAEHLSQNPWPARRIIILISDGEENSSQISSSAATAAVLRAEAVVYTINAGDDDDTDLGKNGAEVLKALSDSTGGNHFRASLDGDIGSAFSKIRKELRSQYELAYKPSDLLGTRFHAIRVVTGNLMVRCRRGYYAK
jgi:VWFA-related protein